jgi:transposase
MIRPAFLLGDERSALIALARDGSVTHRLARRANALVLLDDGLSCEQVARVLLLDDDTIRRWHGAFAAGGRKALMRFEAGVSACVLSEAQRGKLVGWVRAASPRSTGQIGAWIASEFGVEYESRSGLVALLHRLGLEYRKPEVIPRHLDETKQRAFIKLYEKLMNALGADEAVLFVDAVHPTHGARAAGCWAAKDEHLAIEQTTGRQRLNIHGAIDLETGRTKMIEAEAIDAASTIKLLAGIEALCSTTALIHVFLDNARYHHAKIVRKWLSQPGRRIALHFVPSYCPGGVRANSRAVPAVLASRMSNPFRYFNSSPEVIRLVVMMYVRYPLSLRNVEDLLAERGIDISHETVRFWWNRFGPIFAAEIRKKRVASMRGYPQWR